MERLTPDKTKQQLFIVCFFALVWIAAVYPLMQRGLVAHENQDLPYHLLRIEGIKEELALGHFPARINGMVLNGYGYANSLCYPDILLYFPALLRLLGMSLEWAYKLFVLVITFLTMLSAYFSMKYISKDRFASLLFTTLLLLSQYRLSNVYLRAAAGEYCAYLFMPLVLAGIDDFLDQNFGHPWIIGLGFLGLLLTHSITFALGVLITILFFLCSWKKLWSDKRKLKKLVLTALVVLGLSCYYWAPFLEQLFSQTFLFHTPWAIPSEWAVAPITLLDYRFYAGLGLPLLLFQAFRLMIREDAEIGLLKKADTWLFAGLLLVFMATTLFPWSLLDHTFLRSIQFPWRLFAFASVFLGMAAGAFAALAFRKKTRLRVLLIVLVCSIGFAMAYLHPLIKPNLLVDANHDQELGTYSIGAGEWLPEGVNTDDLNEPNTVRDDQGQPIALTSKKGTTVTFMAEEGRTYYDVPLIYYKGYTAVLGKEDGEELRVESAPDTHLVRIWTSRGGLVTVAYTGTWIQKVSGVLSVLTLIGYGIVIYRKRKAAA